MRFTTVQKKIIFNNIITRHRLIHTSQCARTNDPDILVEKPLNTHTQQLFDRHKSAILYSSHMERNQLNLGYVKTKILTKMLKDREQKLANENVKVRPFSVALKYWDEAKTDIDEEDIVEVSPKDTQWKTDLINEMSNSRRKVELFKELKQSESVLVDKDEQKPFVNDWMNDYDIFDDSKCSTHTQFGTPDPSVPVSKIPCYGCGALLQCADSSLPGYLPSELFKGRRREVLKVKNMTKVRRIFAITTLSLPDRPLSTMSFPQELQHCNQYQSVVRTVCGNDLNDKRQICVGYSND